MQEALPQEPLPPPAQTQSDIGLEIRAPDLPDLFGRAALAGIAEAPFEVDSYQELLGREAQIIGCSDHLLQELPILLEFLSQGRIDLSHVITESVSLDAKAINDVLDSLEHFTGHVRTVIKPAQ